MGATKIIYLFVNSGIVLYYLFICKFRHCLTGLGLVLKCAYKTCGSIVYSLVQMLDAFFLALSKLNYRHLAMNFGLFEQIVSLYLITRLINICFECNIF